MGSKLSEKITRYAVKNGYIKQKQYEEYSYAITLFVNIVITDATMLAIGAAMGMLWECIVFWLIYKILRKYCGGFHFSTSFRCYLSSCIMCPIVLVIIHISSSNVYFWGFAAMLSAVFLFALSPVAAINKPLDDKERRVYGIAAKVLVVFAAAFWVIISAIFQCRELSKVVCLSMISVAAFVVAGKISLLRQTTEVVSQKI